MYHESNLENVYQMTDILKVMHFNGYSPEAEWNLIISRPSPSRMVWPQPSLAPDLMPFSLLLWLLIVPILPNSFFSGSLRTLLPLLAHFFLLCSQHPSFNSQRVSVPQTSLSSAQSQVPLPLNLSHSILSFPPLS